MDRKIDKKVIKYYKKSLVKQKIKNFALITTTVGVILIGPFIITPIDSIVIEEEIEYEKEKNAENRLYTALEVEYLANGLFFFDKNIYAAAITNEIMMNNAELKFTIDDGVKGISDKMLVASSGDTKITITSDSYYFSIEYAYTATSKFHDFESISYGYSNNRLDCWDTVVRKYGSKDNELTVKLAKSFYGEEVVEYEIFIIKSGDSEIKLVSSSDVFILVDGEEVYPLTEEQHYQIKKLYKDGEDGSLSLCYSLVANELDKQISAKKKTK